MKTPTYVTLEPCVHNTDGSSLTCYFPEGTTEEEAKEWLKEANPGDFPMVPLWVDTEDFDTTHTECAFPGYERFQFDFVE